MSDQIILQTHHLTKKFKNILAVSDINLTIYKGDIFGFLGPNGAGKSTTIRMILGLIRPTAGKIKLFNKNLNRNRINILKEVGALVEKPCFYGYLSARQNLEIFSDLLQNEDKREIDRVLDIVDLNTRANDKVKTFSHGMNQRLGIAQALIGNPQFIILDEPTAGLDPVGMKDIRQLILQLAQQGLTIFLSSHLLHEIEQICTKMAIINNGKLIIQGDVGQLLKVDSNTVSLKIDRIEDAFNLLKSLKWINELEIDADQLNVTIEYNEVPQLIKFLVESDFNIFEVRPRRSLEDYFLNIVEEN